MISKRDKQRGGALLVALSAAVFLGVSVSLVMLIRQQGNTLSIQVQKKSQARLMAQSGLNYALSRLAEGEANSSFQPIDSMRYNIRENRLFFDLSLKPYGLFAKIKTLGVQTGSASTQNYPMTALAGQLLPLIEYPAICLTSKQSNIILSGKSRIQGPVMLWNGSVRKSYNIKMAAEKGAGHSGPTWDSSHTAWKKIRIHLEHVDKWISLQNGLLQSSSGKIKLVDTLIRETRIVADSIHIATNTELHDCELIGNKILINGNAKIDQGLVYARGPLTITGNPSLDGQFISTDSMLLVVNKTQPKRPAFYVHGRKQILSATDSSYFGTLNIDQYDGNGVFVFGGWEKPEHESQVHLVLAAGSNVRGLVYCNGMASISGNLAGSLITSNLRFTYKGTIWFGHLKDSRISHDASASDMLAPFIFDRSNIPVIYGAKKG